jgi:hypothetical protein
MMFNAGTDFTQLSDDALIEAFHLMGEECDYAEALCRELKRRNIEL